VTSFTETERLWQRVLREEDCAHLVDYMNDWDVNGPLEHPPFPYSYADAKSFLDKMQKGYEIGRPELFVLSDKGTDEMMGAIGVHPEHTFSQRAYVGEIGYWLGKPYWGQGYMSEALPVVMRYTFEKLNLKMIVATTNTDNERSKNVLHRFGFSYLGDHRRPQPTLRGTESVSRWELTFDEFEKRMKP